MNLPTAFIRENTKDSSTNVWVWPHWITVFGITDKKLTNHLIFAKTLALAFWFCNISFRAHNLISHNTVCHNTKPSTYKSQRLSILVLQTTSHHGKWIKDGVIHFLRDLFLWVWLMTATRVTESRGRTWSCGWGKEHNSSSTSGDLLLFIIL